MTGPVWYRETVLFLPADVVAAAADALAHCKQDLALPDAVRVRWLLALADEHEAATCRAAGVVVHRSRVLVSGFSTFGSNDVWILAMLTAEEVRRTVRHEARHVWQNARYGRWQSLADLDGREEDAESYARGLLQRVHDR